MKWFGREKNPQPVTGPGAATEASAPATDATPASTPNADQPDATPAKGTEAVEDANVPAEMGDRSSEGSEAGGLGSVGLTEASEQIGPPSADEHAPAPNALPEAEPTSNWWLTTRRILGWLSTILMLAILFLAWPLAWGGLFSYTVVSGNSMEPTYHTGDVVMTYRTSDYQVGDVIVYTVTLDDKTGAIVHRIIEVLPDGTYKTKGDNNGFADPWVAEPQNIRGEVIAMFPQAYKVIGIIRSPLFWIIPIGVMVAFFLWPAPAPEIPPDGEGEDADGTEGADPPTTEEVGAP